MKITSKIWSTWHHDVETALDQSLASLGTDYLDRTFPVRTVVATTT